MYEITVTNGTDTELLHDLLPDSLRKVLTGNFTQIAAEICRPTAQFSLSPHHPAYNNIHEMRTLLAIRNTLTDQIVFEGRVLQVQDTLGNDGKIRKTYTAEGLIAWLLDSCQLYRTALETPAEFLAYLLARHNEKYPGKAILPGICDVSARLQCTTNYRSTLEEISVNLLKRLGGEIAVRRDANGILRLDYLQDGIGEQKETIVQLGRNLRSLTRSADPAKIVNRLIPLGAKQQDGSRLTLQGYYPEEPFRVWVEDAASAAQYTPIEGTAVVDDAETQAELEQKALAELHSSAAAKCGYSAEVLDLSVIGAEPDMLEAGNTYRFVCRTNGLDADLRLVKCTVDILKPYIPVVEIGSRPERLSYTGATTKATVEALNEKLDIIIEEGIGELGDWVTTADFEAYQEELSTYLADLDIWRGNVSTALQSINSWQQSVESVLSSMQTQIAALQTNAVTSSDIREIDKVSTMPANPAAATLYVIAGNAS
jgi:hypothetical protein